MRKSLQKAVAKVARFDDVTVDLSLVSSSVSASARLSDGSVILIGPMVSDELMKTKCCEVACLEMFDGVARLSKLFNCSMKAWWRPHDGYLDPGLYRGSKVVERRF